MEDGAGAVVVKVGAVGGELVEAPEAVGGAGDDDLGRGDGVEQGRAVGAVAVGVLAGDGGRGGLDAHDVLVDGLDLGQDRGRLEPRGVVVGAVAGGGLGGRRHGHGVGDAGHEGALLGRSAAAVGDGTRLDAGVGLLNLEVTGDEGAARYY